MGLVIYHCQLTSILHPSIVQLQQLVLNFLVQEKRNSRKIKC